MSDIIEFPQIRQAKAALAALKTVYGDLRLGDVSTETELLTRLLTDLRLLASEGYAPLDVNDCCMRSHSRWNKEHPLKR